jgi:excisionase family DNA binding protein
VEQAYLTTREAAERLRLSEAVIRRWVKSGKLSGARLSRRAGFRIERASVEKLLVPSAVTQPR